MAIAAVASGRPLGAEIQGLDPTREMTDEEYGFVRAALVEHKVLVVPLPDAGIDTLLKFGRRFGKLVPHILTQYHHPATPDVSVISNVRDDGKGRETAKPAGAFWHSDLSYEAVPADATMLYSVEIPPRGGNTRFINMSRAYEALPQQMKDRIDGLTAIHRYGWNGGQAIVEIDAETRRRYPDVEHPMVRVHRESGEKTLYVNPGFTMAIKDMDRSESDELLAKLFAHAQQPAFEYRHVWAQGQVVACDNRTTMHCATADYTERRTLWRMIVGGSG